MKETFSIDKDQVNILYVYSLYSNQLHNSYLQYTAACALMFHLTTKGIFDYNTEELLVYDYKDERRYIWEAKKFMSDINVLRDHSLLIRARVPSEKSRDVNAHQCSIKGHEYLREFSAYSSSTKALFSRIKELLYCKNGTVKEIELTKEGPILKCKHQQELIKGFLKCFKSNSSKNTQVPDYSPFFL